MSLPLSPNAQAILLLTAPLIVGRERGEAALLTPAQYNRLAQVLRERQRQPSDLLGADAEALCAELGAALAPKIDAERLRVLLGRGFQLSQAVAGWQARALWVTSRADLNYPRRLKARLKDDAPPVIYGCGDRTLLERGGLAVVGSRHVNEALIAYTEAVGRLATRAGRTLISGAARGIDQAAMRGALEAQGRAVGVLADGLARAAVQRDNRDLLLDERLVLISPYDPAASFNVGNAMQRNKLVYALADAALVVSAEREKGGTWAGAVEHLKKHRAVPVYVRTAGEPSLGLDGLRELGASPWPEPAEPADLAAILAAPTERGDAASDETQGVQGPASATATPGPAAPVPGLSTALPDVPEQERSPGSAPAAGEAAVPVATCDPARQRTSSQATDREAGPSMEVPAQRSAGGADAAPPNPAEILFATVRALLERIPTPKTDAEIAEELAVSRLQAKEWLARLVDEGVLEKTSRPVRYRRPQGSQQRSLPLMPRADL